jgi:hypothetical protein
MNSGFSRNLGMTSINIVLTHGFSTGHVTVERCMRTIPTIIYLPINGDHSSAHGFNKKSHEYDTREQVLRPGHDYELGRER